MKHDSEVYSNIKYDNNNVFDRIWTSETTYAASKSDQSAWYLYFQTVIYVAWYLLRSFHQVPKDQMTSLPFISLLYCRNPPVTILASPVIHIDKAFIDYP